MAVRRIIRVANQFILKSLTANRVWKEEKRDAKLYPLPPSPPHNPSPSTPYTKLFSFPLYHTFSPLPHSSPHPPPISSSFTPYFSLPPLYPFRFTLLSPVLFSSFPYLSYEHEIHLHLTTPPQPPLYLPPPLLPAPPSIMILHPLGPSLPPFPFLFTPLSSSLSQPSTPSSLHCSFSFLFIPPPHPHHSFPYLPNPPLTPSLFPTPLHSQLNLRYYP